MLANGAGYEPNRHPVLRDQKVLPEVRNEPLLLREIISHSTFEIPSKSNSGTFAFLYSTSDILITPS